LRRLFSTFAQGPPGLGLLLLRIVTAAALVARGFTGAIPDIVAAGAGILLLLGLWTPVSGSMVAILEFWNAISLPGDPWVSILTGTLGLALALVGPGRWSMDARLFGWRRIDIRDRNQLGLLMTR
jgi:putative oxidoreductase